MTKQEAIQEALRQAAQKNVVYYVLYNPTSTALDWRNRYIATTYLPFAATHPKEVKAQVLPDGRILDREGNPLVVAYD